MNVLDEIKGTVLIAAAYFAIYSFVGWLIEGAYRSWTQRRFVNAGFLFGPFVPIYGIGALLVLAMRWLFADLHFSIGFLLIGLTLTVLEYVVTVACEHLFALKLWDYSENRYNFQGRVCLLYSAIWAVLALGFGEWLHPPVKAFVQTIDRGHLKAGVLVFALYLVIDLSLSVASVAEFRQKIGLLLSDYLSLSNAELDRVFASSRRLLRAFPDLNHYIHDNLTENLKRRAGGMLAAVAARFHEEIKERMPKDQEYNDIVTDILANPEFQRLGEFFHHNSSILDHVQGVSYLSYRICKYLGLDYHAAARGGLLHDFFLYDWRDHDEPDLARKKFHGLHHPRIALENSKKQFSVSDVEKDIILKHMWPLTLKPPRYRESFVVSFVDKFLSSKEFVGEFAKQAVGFVGKKAVRLSRRN